MKFSWCWLSYTLIVYSSLSSCMAKGEKEHADSVGTISVRDTTIAPSKVSSQKDTELETVGIEELQTKPKGVQLLPDTLLGAYINIREVYANLDTSWGIVQATDSLTLTKGPDGTIAFSLMLICGNLPLCFMEGVAVLQDGYLEYRELLDFLDPPEECVLRIRFAGNEVILEDSTGNCRRGDRCGVSIDVWYVIDGIRLFKVRKDSIVRLKVMEAKKEIKHPKAQELELLISALKDKYYKVQLEAIQILGELNDSTVVQPLIDVVKDKDEDEEVRTQTIETLGKIKDQRIIEPLIEAITDENSEVRKLAIETLKTLGKINDPRIVEPLIDATKDEDSDVRVLAIDTLGDIKDPKTIPALIDALKDEHWHVQWAARRALVDMTGNDFGASWGNWQEWWNKNKAK